jgi:hypothetical protein
MAYTLISSQTLASSAASVTFSSIPSTYKDLVLKVSGRSDASGITYDDLTIRPNNNSSVVYSYTALVGTGSGGAGSSNGSIQNLGVDLYSLTGATATASTFGNAEIYIPSYTVSQNKPWSVFGVSETNATAANMAAVANLWRNTAAISSLILGLNNGTNFVSGSSFYLYGIN